MFPLVIIAILLVVLLGFLALYVTSSVKQIEVRAQDMIREAFAKENEAIVKVKDYNLKNDAQDREIARLSKEIREIREFARMPAKTL